MPVTEAGDLLPSLAGGVVARFGAGDADREVAALCLHRVGPK